MGICWERNFETTQQVHGMSWDLIEKVEDATKEFLLLTTE